MAAVKQFVNRVDRELPPPVFYSVANMTRLVAWEARQALEVGDQHFSIQWMSVDRNEQGGVDLVGLFRDLPEFDMYGQVRNPMVRAQRHTIHTDKWCRVINAGIEDVMVPIPAGAPAGAMPLVNEGQHDAPAKVRIRLPQQHDIDTQALAQNMRIPLSQPQNTPERQPTNVPVNARMPVPK
jgi:hypothetical protein